ncbi:ribonuclease P protein component [Palleronia caenipelagi]|uniref:Ribonuclease P protein component n=1 Tax=Palleronia caenipelagi TaxID=2489174 RepID=A0A547Q739_9RHOB|nr:ribonuclease P protein component [Palleronia caenipelagi]TRD22196.1 ribonuclease P protein component [Palleronia caenipelagi]
MATDRPAADPAGGPVSFEVLTKRADFLRAARARYVRRPGLILQARERGEGDGVRVGYTCSKKVGNAVARNRAKRRLREVVRLELPDLGRPGWDYVLIGKREITADRDFVKLRRDLASALMEIHG